MSQGAYTSTRELARLRYQARGFSYLPAQPVGSVLSGRKRSRLRGRGLDFDELRHYRPGDDIRNMDWKVTRRTGQPYIRVFTEERDRPVWILVDQRLSMFFGSEYQLKSVASADIAALTAWRVISQGDRVGCLMFNDHEHYMAKPSRSPGKIMSWLAKLAAMNNALHANASWTSDAEAFHRALKKLSTQVHHDGLIVIASDFYGWNPACLEAIKQIRQHNDVICALVSDPLERDISSARKLVVSDGRFQLEIDPEHKDTRQRYQTDFANSYESIEASLKRHNIPLLSIDTRLPAATQLQRQLSGQSASHVATAGKEHAK